MEKGYIQANSSSALNYGTKAKRNNLHVVKPRILQLFVDILVKKQTGKLSNFIESYPIFPIRGVLGRKIMKRICMY